jgi:hypothetical protein
VARTKKKPYTGSKKFDRSCRNHGACPYCKANRTFSDKKVRLVTEDELVEEKNND